MGELPKVSIDSKNTMNIREYSDLKDIVKAYDDKLNEAYMNWDFETIKNLFTEDMILDQEGQPSVIGLENFLWQLRTSKKGGLDFRDLDDHIIKAWEDIQNIYSLENYSFRIRLENEGIEMNGLGSAFTIWQKQKDETLKIKYSIHTLNDVPIVNEIKEKRK